MYKYWATKSCACAKENAHTGACRNVVWPRARGILQNLDCGLMDWTVDWTMDRMFDDHYPFQGLATYCEHSPLIAEPRLLFS